MALDSAEVVSSVGFMLDHCDDSDMLRHNGWPTTSIRSDEIVVTLEQFLLKLSSDSDACILITGASGDAISCIQQNG